MSIVISDVIKQLETLYPKHLAAFDKDPNGLHIGNVNRPLTKVLVTLDVTKSVVEEAIVPLRVRELVHLNRLMEVNRF